jgi:hypothetical protein
MSLEGILEIATPWWPLVMQVVLFWYLTQLGKKQLWTKAMAEKNTAMRILRNTKGLHPLAWGALWGSGFPAAPAVAAATTMGEAVMWGVGAGLGSLMGHKILAAIAEKRGWAGVLNVLKTTGDRDTVKPPKDASN